MESAENEFIIMTSSTGLLNMHKNKKLLKGWVEKGVIVQIIEPINSENLHAARRLLECCEIRHVRRGYIRSVTVDGKHLFRFKTSAMEKEIEGLLAYFKNSWYTNDPGFVQGRRELFKDIGTAPLN
jgi:hypothetical protein